MGIDNSRLFVRVSNRNSVAHCVAEHSAIFTAISARFVAHIPLPLAPNLGLKVSFLAHQQCGILGAIKVYFSINFIYFWLSNFLTPTYIISVYTWIFISKHSENTLKIVLSLFCNVVDPDPVGSGLFGSPGFESGKNTGSGSFIKKKTPIILIFSLYKII